MTTFELILLSTLGAIEAWYWLWWFPRHWREIDWSKP